METLDNAGGQECCPKRRVGSSTYILVEPGQNPPLDMGGCLDNCAYRLGAMSNLPENKILHTRLRGEIEGEDFNKVFCFERGNQSSACLGKLQKLQYFFKTSP